MMAKCQTATDARPSQPWSQRSGAPVASVADRAPTLCGLNRVSVHRHSRQLVYNMTKFVTSVVECLDSCDDLSALENSCVQWGAETSRKVSVPPHLLEIQMNSTRHRSFRSPPITTLDGHNWRHPVKRDDTQSIDHCQPTLPSVIY